MSYIMIATIIYHVLHYDRYIQQRDTYSESPNAARGSMVHIIQQRANAVIVTLQRSR